MCVFFLQIEKWMLSVCAKQWILTTLFISKVLQICWLINIQNVFWRLVYLIILFFNTLWEFGTHGTQHNKPLLFCIAAPDQIIVFLQVVSESIQAEREMNQDLLLQCPACSQTGKSFFIHELPFIPWHHQHLNLSWRWDKQNFVSPLLLKVVANCLALFS